MVSDYHAGYLLPYEIIRAPCCARSSWNMDVEGLTALGRTVIGVPAEGQGKQLGYEVFTSLGKAIALHTSCDDGVVNRAKKAFTRGFESAGEANKWWQRVGQRRSSGTLIWAIGASTSARCCWPRAWQRIHRRASRALVGAGQKRPLPIAFCPRIGWNGTTS